MRLLLLPLALAVACVPGPEPSYPMGTLPGESSRPYGALPEYLVPPPPSFDTRVGFYSDRVPVAGGRRRELPPAEVLDGIRLRLAQIDTAAISLRTAATPEPTALEVERLADELAELLRDRPDLVAEMSELKEMARQLRTARGLVRDHTVSRVEELTDLVRLQIDSG